MSATREAWEHATEVLQLTLQGRRIVESIFCCQILVYENLEHKFWHAPVKSLLLSSLKFAGRSLIMMELHNVVILLHYLEDVF